MSKFEQKIYNDGDILFNSGDRAETFFIIKQGKIKIFDPSSNLEIAVLNTGESFGEQSFISQGVRSASASAVGSTVCLESPDSQAQTFYQLVGEDEADLKSSKISVSSPLGRSLIGKYVDDEVQVQTPKGMAYYSILSVEYK